MEEPGRLQSMGSLRVTCYFTFIFHFHVLEKAIATHCSVLAWRIPGAGEPGGLPSMGSHRVRHDWSDIAAAAAGHRGGKDGGFVSGASLINLVHLIAPVTWVGSSHPIYGDAKGSGKPEVWQLQHESSSKANVSKVRKTWNDTEEGPSVVYM